MLLSVLFLITLVPCIARSGGSTALHPPSRIPSPLLSESRSIFVRGGQSSQQDPYGNYGGDYSNSQQPYQSQYPEEDGFTNYEPPPEYRDDFFQESVQEGVERWRQEQLAHQQDYLRPESEMKLRDAQGRMKLLATVSKGSRSVIFFILMWRDIHLYEIADQAFKGTFRLLMVTPLISLFIGNMAGVITSFTQQSHATKKRMKAILNLDKLVEGILLVYYLLRLTVVPSKHIPREIYVAKTLHSVIFMVQLQAYTRVTW